MQTTGKISYKKYACKQCGHEKLIDTNHYGECYSWGNFNLCPKCPPYKRPNTWVCQEAPPEGMGIPDPWKTVEIEVEIPR
jgi:hypothetical protein